jgi:hypothetical protein
MNQMGQKIFAMIALGTFAYALWSERGWAYSMVILLTNFGTLMRDPLCFNPPAARFILPMDFKRTEMVLAGQSKAPILEGIKTFIKQKLPPRVQPWA